MIKEITMHPLKKVHLTVRRSYRCSFIKLVIFFSDLLTIILIPEWDPMTSLCIIIFLNVDFAESRVLRTLFGEKVLSFELLTGIAITFLDNTQVVLTTLVIHLLNIHRVLFFHICLLENRKLLRIHLNFVILMMMMKAACFWDYWLFFGFV